VARASHNDLILAIVAHINAALRETREWSLRARSGAQRSLQHYHKIVTAIARRDSQAAQEAMAIHVEDVQIMALRSLQECAEEPSPSGRKRDVAPALAEPCRRVGPRLAAPPDVRRTPTGRPLLRSPSP
jgi:hypothetical protein